MTLGGEGEGLWKPCGWGVVGDTFVCSRYMSCVVLHCEYNKDLITKRNPKALARNYILCKSFWGQNMEFMHGKLKVQGRGLGHYSKIVL